ncbi:erythromycin esterase family protein [Streptomyces sp. NPDC003860]
MSDRQAAPLVPYARDVVQWIEGRAHRLATYDPLAPLADLHPLVPLVGDAQVVALGVASRQTHELSALVHRSIRLLVEEAGFRAVTLEGDDPARLGLDAYVGTGAGDPRELLAGARPFLRTGEVLGLVEWMRSYNVRHPDDPVRFTATVPGTEPSPPADGMAGIERDLAQHVIRWHEQPGSPGTPGKLGKPGLPGEPGTLGNKDVKVIYWGGLVHTANRAPRTPAPTSPPPTHLSAGGHLRRHYGPGYVSVGLTFHHGTAVAPGDADLRIPAPPADFAEAVLGGAEPAAYLLDLRGDAPAPVSAWLDAATRTRFVGPGFTAADHAEHHIADGALRDWFDAVVHVREVTPNRPPTG